MTEEPKYTTAYSYDPATGEYIGECRAHKNPLEDGYLLPAHATYKAPPTVAEHEAAVWDKAKDKWKKVSDWRGAIYYDTTTQERHEIQNLSEEPAADWTDIPPTDREAIFSGDMWIIPFPVLRERKATEIQTRSNSLISAIRQGYTEGETQTFEQQNIGAKSILAGVETTSEAQFVIALLTGRIGATPTPEEKTAFAERIRSNYDAAATATAQIVGTQQRLELAARGAETEEQLDAIVWPNEED